MNFCNVLIDVLVRYLFCLPFLNYVCEDIHVFSSSRIDNKNNNNGHTCIYSAAPGGGGVVTAIGGCTRCVRTFLFYFILFPFHINHKRPQFVRNTINVSKYIITCINPTELTVFEYNSHIRPNRLSGWVLVPTWPYNEVGLYTFAVSCQPDLCKSRCSIPIFGFESGFVLL